MKLLEVQGIAKTFGGVTAVSDLSLSLHRGEILSIIGPNGSGKTTLFNLISGVYSPDRGRILLEDRDITGWGPNRIAQAGVSRTFQQIRVFGSMSVAENILLGSHCQLRKVRARQFSPRGRLGETLEPLLEWARLPLEFVLAILQPGSIRREEAEVRRTAEETMVRFGDHLLPLQESSAFSLSYANRRRTEIARALTLGPRLLLLDEPSAGMDPSETRELTEELLRIRDMGITIMLIEHKLEMVMSVSDRVIVMNYGVKIAEGKPAQVQNDEQVIEAYLGRKASHAQS